MSVKAIVLVDKWDSEMVVSLEASTAGWLAGKKVAMTVEQ